DPLMNLSRRALLAHSAAVGIAESCLGTAFAATPATQDAPLNGLFDSLVEALLQDSPESATFLGLDKGARAALKSRLSDQSWAHIAEDHKTCAAWLEKLNRIDSRNLSPAGQVHKGVVSYALTLGRDAGAFDFGENTLASVMNEAATPYVVSQQTGTFVNAP